MTRKEFAKHKHLIVGITASYSPELVKEVQTLLTKVESNLPLVEK